MAEYYLDQAWHAERERLDSMAALWDPGTLALARQCGLAPGQSVLEVGAGAGSVARQFAAEVGPAGLVTAVDIETRFLADIDLPQVEIVQCDDRTEALPAARYDLVHCRMMLEHLVATSGDVLDAMIAALKPGGWLLVEDYDWHGIEVPWPETPVLRAFFEPVFAFLTGQGLYDPHYGRTLLARLRAAGLSDTSAQYRGVQLFCDPDRGVAPFDLFAAQISPQLVAAGVIGQQHVDALSALTHDGRSVVPSPMMFAAFGRKPTA